MDFAAQNGKTHIKNRAKRKDECNRSQKLLSVHRDAEKTVSVCLHGRKDAAADQGRNETENAATVTKTTESTDKNQEPTPDPYRWRYIFFIALLGVALLLYLKRTPIVNWIRKILSGILKIL